MSCLGLRTLSFSFVFFLFCLFISCRENKPGSVAISGRRYKKEDECPLGSTSSIDCLRRGAKLCLSHDVFPPRLFSMSGFLCSVICSKARPGDQQQRDLGLHSVVLVVRLVFVFSSLG